MNNLGVMYEKGRGTRKNMKLAAQWYLKAAAGGDANAMNNIGWFYETGRGRAVERSSQKAVDYFLKSLRLGSPHAKATFTKYANALSSRTKTEVQLRLRQAGVYSGVIDGQIGPGTRRALALYVKSGK